MSNQPPVLGPDGVARPYIGGQALIEGVMMRSPHAYAAVVRRRDGSLTLRESPMDDPRRGWKALPLARGVVTLVESLRLGSRTLQFSAELYEADLAAEEAASAAAPATGAAPTPAAGSATRSAASTSASAWWAAVSLPVLALATAGPDGPPPAPPPEKPGSAVTTWVSVGLALTLFVALPQAAAVGASKLFGLGLEVRDAGFQVITGAAKLCIVVGYMAAVRRIPEIYRVFQYHGAEHKSIYAYEAGLPLAVPSARAQSTLHPRCGTTFLVMVAMVSILVFTVLGPFLPKVGGGALAENVVFFLMKLPFLPIIAAITFEIQRVLARFCSTGPLRALLWPGFLVQKITTIEPDDTQLEVALGALGAALHREQAGEPAPAAGPDRTFADLPALLAR